MPWPGLECGGLLPYRRDQPFGLQRLGPELENERAHLLHARFGEGDDVVEDLGDLGRICVEILARGRRALSVVLGGASVSWVLGVPVVADLFGWRASFVLVDVLAAVAAAGVGTLLPAVKNPRLPVGLASRLAVVGRPAILSTLAVTVLGMAAAFTTLTYVHPLLGDLMGFGSRGIASMLLLFGLASIVGSVLGGYGADRRGYGQNVVTVLVVLAFSLLLFSLLPTVGVGPTSAAVGAGVALAGWAVAGFALVPLQQHRLIRIAPDQQNGALALNACAIYAGQEFGTVLGSLILGYASLVALGGAGAACAAAALIASILSARLSAKAS